MGTELKSAGYRFVRVAGIGLIVTFLLLVFVGMPNTPEVVLITAFLTALDKYLRDKEVY